MTVEPRDLARRLMAGESVDALAAESGTTPEQLEWWRDQALADLERRLNGSPQADLPERLHHIGIVARDQAQMDRFVARLGLREVRREHLPKYHVTNIFFDAGGGAQIQFMLPDGGILANFNQGRGGLHHLAFCASDITPIQRRLEGEGVRFIAKDKQQGIGRFQFNFVLPNLEGVNIELIEDPDGPQ